MGDGASRRAATGSQTDAVGREAQNRAPDPCPDDLGEGHHLIRRCNLKPMPRLWLGWAGLHAPSRNQEAKWGHLGVHSGWALKHAGIWTASLHLGMSLPAGSRAQRRCLSARLSAQGATSAGVGTARRRLATAPRNFSCSSSSWHAAHPIQCACGGQTKTLACLPSSSRSQRDYQSIPRSASEGVGCNNSQGQQMHAL